MGARSISRAARYNAGMNRHRGSHSTKRKLWVPPATSLLSTTIREESSMWNSFLVGSHHRPGQHTRSSQTISTGRHCTRGESRALVLDIVHLLRTKLSNFL